jgi:tetratricopeptide (TPR) repeat protein
MYLAVRAIAGLTIFLMVVASGARGQGELERPERFVPLRPQTRQELAQGEARKLYGLGLLRQHEDRLLEAAQIFEEALQLDPEAVPLHRVLVPLYLAVNRTEDALKACRKTLELAPGDYAIWALYARQLKNQGEASEARQALQRGLACVGLSEHVDLRVQMQYDLGLLCERLEDYAAAVDAFGEVLKVLDGPQALVELSSLSRSELAEQAANTYERTVKLCIQAKQFDRALTLFAAGKEKYPALARRLNFSLAKVYQAQGQPQKALSCLDDYLKLQPPGLEPYELRSALLQELNRGHEMLSALQELADRDSHNIGLHLYLARQYAQGGRKEEAERLYLTLAEQSPTAEIYRALFGLYEKNRQLPRIVELLDEALGKAEKKEKSPEVIDRQAAAKARVLLVVLREDPGLAKRVVNQARLNEFQRVKGLNRDTPYYLAVLAARGHQLEEANYFYRRCLQRMPEQLPEYAVYGGLIQVLREGHNYEAIVEVCRRGIHDTQNVNHVFFHRSLSQALVYLGRIEEGLNEANKAVELADDRTRLPARLNRVHLLAYADRCPQAEVEAKALLKDFTQRDEVRQIRYTLSSIYSTGRDYSKAEEQLQLILKDDPNDATANNDLGYQWADQGKNLDEAERMIRKALALDAEQRKTLVDERDEKENAAFLDSLGWVLFRRGQLEPARRWLEKAASAMEGQEDPVMWDHLGDVYFRLELNEKARDAWQKALVLYEIGKERKLDEHYKELKHKLQLLRSSP